MDDGPICIKLDNLLQSSVLTYPLQVGSNLNSMVTSTAEAVAAPNSADDPTLVIQDLSANDTCLCCRAAKIAMLHMS